MELKWVIKFPLIIVCVLSSKPFMYCSGQWIKSGHSDDMVISRLIHLILGHAPGIDEWACRHLLLLDDLNWPFLYTCITDSVFPSVDDGQGEEGTGEEGARGIICTWPSGGDWRRNGGREEEKRKQKCGALLIKGPLLVEHVLFRCSFQHVHRLVYMGPSVFQKAAMLSMAWCSAEMNSEQRNYCCQLHKIPQNAIMQIFMTNGCSICVPLELRLS